MRELMFRIAEGSIAEGIKRRAGFIVLCHCPDVFCLRETDCSGCFLPEPPVSFYGKAIIKSIRNCLQISATGLSQFLLYFRAFV